jgi:hypothetical protein
MPLNKGSQKFPQTQRDWDQWTRSQIVTPDPDSVTTPTIQDKQVTYSKFQDVPPVTVLGNQHSTLQSVGSITAGADNRFLASRSGVLVFDVLADTDIPSSIARDTEVTSAISTALAPYITQTAADARYVQLANVLNGSKTYDPPSLTTGTQTTTTVTVTGAVLGDYARSSFSLDLQGLTMSAYVSAADTVTVVTLNITGGTLDLAGGTLRVRVWKQ